MKLNEAMVMWNPNSSNIKVMSRDVYLKEVQNYAIRKRYKTSFPYWFSGRDERFQSLSVLESKLIIYIEAIHIIVRDKVDPNAVHEALLNIDEYVDCLANDMKK
jgi:hypothetical protein